MNIIVAYDKKNGIGANNDLPWNISKDMKHFSTITSGTSNPKSINVVIMGRNTWESIPEKHRPLKNRINIIVSSKMSNIDLPENTYVVKSLDEALNYSKYNGNITSNISNKTKLNLDEIVENVFVIGGEGLYKEAINHEKIEKLYITQIYSVYECNRFFPEIPNEFSLTSVSDFQEENGIYFRYLTYEKNVSDENKWVNYEEMQYINMLEYILKNGLERCDRTGVGTISTFGKQFNYDLSKTFPLLTTKRMFVRAVFYELALYISGKTDNGILQDQRIHIWDGNTTRDFLDKRGLNQYPENDMGETYGFNFRHYGADYITCKENYSGKGFDQLKYVIDQIKNNPTSRRIIINLWNAATMHKAALPACLCMYQFYVDTKNKKLNLQIYIRSSDFFLANNWNTCTGAFLVHMICNLKDIDLTPGELSVITGDTHLYINHIDAVKTNIERTPRTYPMLLIKEPKESIEDYSWEDFKIIGYNPMPNISAPMAV